MLGDRAAWRYNEVVTNGRDDTFTAQGQV